MSARSAAADAPALAVIVGPTASGKSDLALEWARRHGGEIISADSVQIYRYFDIGSGKPNPEELRSVPHHLLDAIEPTEEMDAGLFAERARAIVDDVLSRGRLPIVCGGTFLWVKALIYGLAPTPPKDAELRKQHQAFAAAEGRAALHARLRDVDPESHARLAPNDLVRVSRALEVYELTGKPLTAFQREHGFLAPRYRAKLFGVRHSRQELHHRIRTRTERMFERGWLQEAQELMTRGFGATRPMQSVGYLQVLRAIEQGATHASEPLCESVAQATRVFARRQMTWLREQPVTWLEPRATSDFDPTPLLSASD